MSKKFLDGLNVEHSTAAELLAVLKRLIMHPEVVFITDANGVPVERVTLFSEKLTDGSVVQSVELRFHDSATDERHTGDEGSCPCASCYYTREFARAQQKTARVNRPHTGRADCPCDSCKHARARAAKGGKQ